MLYIGFSYVCDKEILSIENYNRIDIPIKYLIKLYDLINSSNLEYNIQKIEDFICSTYSLSYLNKIKYINFDNTLCDICTFQNNLNNIYCVLCNSIMTKNYKKYIDNDNDTLITTNTYKQIIETIKILINIIELYDSYNYYYALIRPPGHHSCFDHHEGFCIINNAYLLANNIIKLYNNKILIFDWDLHHGNGTEKLINDNNNKNIYYISMHYYEINFYPNTGSHNKNNDNIFNIQLNKNTTDEIYLNKFENYAIPFIENIINTIDTIIISNGLDAHIDDPLHCMNLTEKSYIDITKYFKSKNVKIIYLLEGGYNPDVITDISDKIIKKLSE
jgi:acetoin utilization deacetylase AcuC-like enzyme